MGVFIQFALIGLGVGALYGFAALGLVLVYRGSGVLNFAHGAIGISAAYTQWELHVHHGIPWGAAFVVSVVLAGLVGALFHLLVMRRLTRRSALIRVVATLAVLILLQGIAINRYGGNVDAVASMLPQDPWHIAGQVSLLSDRMYLLAIGAALAVALWLIYQYTLFGVATTAVAESDRSAAALGWSRDVIASVNWALGSGLAAAAAILMAPITALSVASMTRLLLATVAAALVGNFRSFGMTFVGGMGIGVVETLVGYYANGWGSSGIGLSASVPFFFIVALLVLRGRALPLRDYLFERQPTVGSGRIRPAVVVVAVGLVVLGLNQLGVTWADSFTTTFTVGVILLSMVVLTGYAGQLSLAQFAIAVFGAWVAGRLVQTQGLRFWEALLAGIGSAVVLGFLLGLPAVRTRGINLAVVTLGLGTALEFVLFQNQAYTGGYFGTTVGAPDLFGWRIDAIGHPYRYASFCVICFALCACVVANLRRGRTGRRLLAVRTNERAAAALGINVVSTKLYAFCVAAGIAALGGILMLFRSPVINFETLSNSTSVLFMGFAVIGGIGYLLGPVIGATFAFGALGMQVTNTIFNDGVSRWIQTFSGAVLLFLILQEPDGVAKAQIDQLRWVGRRLGGILPTRGLLPRMRRARRRTVPTHANALGRVAPQTLDVRDVSVRFGAATAVDGVSLRIEPGEIVGLIGPNGAGKTTFIDAVTGFVPITSGSVAIGDKEVTSWSAARRARTGLSRLFQSLELFEDMTVLDNLRAASEPEDIRSYVVDLVWPRTPDLHPQAIAAIREFGLEDDLERLPTELSFGRRRLVGIARAVALSPSVLLLDEPSGGLSDARSAELAALIRRLADEWGIGILLVAHDVEMVTAICDRVCVLNFGRVIAQGAPAEVAKDPGVVAAYLGSAPEDPRATPEPVLSNDEPAPQRPRFQRLAPVPSEPLIVARGMSVGYFGHAVLHDLNLEVNPGEVVALLGANRAGKTTTLLGLAGVLPPLEGEVWFRGSRTTAPLHRRAREGLAFVGDDRAVFSQLTVAQNLRVGRVSSKNVVPLFPELEPLLRRRAGVLSGGEQQMLGLARALARKPAVLLVDELSLGLAPIIVTRLHDMLREAADTRGVGIVLVEQHVKQALRIADRVYVIGGGRVALEGNVEDVRDRVEDAVLEHSLGDASGRRIAANA